MIHAWYINANLRLIRNVKIQNVLKPLFETLVKYGANWIPWEPEIRTKNERQEKDSWHYWEMILCYERSHCIHITLEDEFKKFDFSLNLAPFSHIFQAFQSNVINNLWSSTAFKSRHPFFRGCRARNVEIHFPGVWTVWSGRWMLRAMGCAVPALSDPEW